MASGDSDHIEVMDSSVTKKTDAGQAGAEDDGNITSFLFAKNAANMIFHIIPNTVTPRPIFFIRIEFIFSYSRSR